MPISMPEIPYLFEICSAGNYIPALLFLMKNEG